MGTAANTADPLLSASKYLVKQLVFPETAERVSAAYSFGRLGDANTTTAVATLAFARGLEAAGCVRRNPIAPPRAPQERQHRGARGRQRCQRMPGQ